jgi:hypothetical protein
MPLFGVQNLRAKAYHKKISTPDWVVPEYVPQDLLTDNERRVNGQLGVSNVLWIRTWYGSGSPAASTSPSSGVSTETAQRDVVSHATADAAYRRLWRAAFFDNDDDPNDDFDDYRAVHRSFIFDDDPVAYGVTQHTSDENVAPTGSTPGFIVKAMMHCPDQLGGFSGGGDWSGTEEEYLATSQNLLVMIADRKACDSGWVLEIGLNHKAEVLPGRIRSKASRIATDYGNWQTEGMALREITMGEDTETYAQRGDGWASD